MASFKFYNVATQVVSSVPCQLTRLEGYFRGAVNSWLQIHDAKTMPANGAVPLKSYYLPSTAPFSWVFDPDHVELTKGFCVAVSTTEGTLTASAETLDAFGEYDGISFIPDGASVAGDTTTPVSNLQVWAEAAGPKRLYRLEVTELLGAARFLLVAPVDTLSANSITGYPFGVLKLGANETKVFDFGQGGTMPYYKDTSGADHYGCTIYNIIADASGNLPAFLGTSSVNAFTCKAYYK